MKKNSLEYIIPGLLALAITVALISFIPVFSEKYRIGLEDTHRMAPDDFNYYFDLNGDGSSEIFSIFYNASGNLAVSISSFERATINQFNLPGILTEQGPVVDLHDINGDSVVDIFICTEKNDSLFLTIIDDLYGRPTHTWTFYLDPINQFNDNGDYLFVTGGLSDLNGDSYPEYIFAVNGGHSLQPRRVYAIDYHNRQVMRSPISGSSVVSLDLFDLDSDGKDEILLNTVAPENFKVPFPYRDSVTWMMVLNESLTFYKPPVPMNSPPSWVSLEPYMVDGKRFLISYHAYNLEGDYHAVLAIYNDSLKMIRSRELYGNMRRGYLWRVEGGFEISNIKLLSNNAIYTLDTALNVVDSLFNSRSFGYEVEVMLDLDADGEKEYISINDNRINIFTSDLHESAGWEITMGERNPRTLISAIENGSAYPLLFVQVGTEQYFLKYYRNRWFQLRFALYPGMFLLSFGLLYLWVTVQNRLVAKRYERERLIQQLQLQSIKNQLDPHFTFNALNAVGSLIYKGEKELAYQYLKGLTDLIRMVSGDSGEITWALSSELDFVVKYLEIEKLRFREKFNYLLEMNEDHLADFPVPKMSLLTFVENAIKHGLRHKESDRRLTISVNRKGRGIRVEIQDNGIGRAAASRYHEESAGYGLDMMRRYFKQYNETEGMNASFRVSDLFEDDQKPAGTMIILTIR